MKSFSLRVFVLIAALLLSVPTPARASGDFEGLRVIKILVEPLEKNAEDDQITRQVLEDQILVTIRSKAPNLRVVPNAATTIYVNLTYLTTGSPSYAAFLQVELNRPVEMLVGTDFPTQPPSRRIWTIATVWHAGGILTGNRSGAADRVRSMLDELLQEFLAAYYRANP